jgi:hypothetical protein
VLLHDNAPLHTVASTSEVTEHFNWELFDHPAYSPGHAPNNYHLSTRLESWLRLQLFNNNEMVEGAKTWLSPQATDFFSLAQIYRK